MTMMMISTEFTKTFLTVSVMSQRKIGCTSILLITRVLETYWEGKHQINDLFVDRGGLQELDRDRLINTIYVKLVKLHGSIDWFKLDDGRIVRSKDNRPKIGGRYVE